MSQVARGLIRLGHSPDPDDAFMFYGIASGRVDTAGLRIEQVISDIETLNRRAIEGSLEVTAVSIHAFGHLAGRWALLPCGASMGDGYGPIVVASGEMDPAELARARIAVPGTLTSAFLALRLYLGQDFEHVVVPFDRILDAVAAGAVDAGLVIHEGQLTYGTMGLHSVVDLGVWWTGRTGLPLPLGGNAVRKDLGAEMIREILRILRESIACGPANREDALRYALPFGRGLDGVLADRFVSMYVNDLTVDYGERGREAVRRFLEEGVAAGLLPPIAPPEFVS